MSVVAQSPLVTGSKRLFIDESNSTHAGCGEAAAAKRARCGASPAARCRGADQGPGLHPSAVAALKSLFPGMDERAVESVLAECGQDIDAAIRRLTDLKLSGAEQAAAAAAAGAAAAASAAAAQPGAEQQAAAATQQQQQQAADAPCAAGPQTAEQWVDALVTEMAAAKDFADARGRAAKMLQAFEAFVGARAKEQQQQQQQQTAAAPGSRLEEVLRENAILKRAVQIQNAKLHDASAREAEAAGLKALLGQYQERLRHLEMSNYSLALHLQKATDDRSAPAHRPPDVF